MTKMDQGGSLGQKIVNWMQSLIWRAGLGTWGEIGSVSRLDLTDDLSGKHVAIVGNARALADQKHGAAIDAADTVIRINRAPIPATESHGQRTDWLALATFISKAIATEKQPRRILWMSHKRKRLRLWMTQTEGFYLHPKKDFQRLKLRIGAPPTTGLMVIDLVAGSQAASVKIYGFDFFASLSLTGSRTATQVPHDFAAEKAWVEELAARDARITVVT